MRRIFLITLFTSLIGYSQTGGPPAVTPDANDVTANICDDDGTDDGQKSTDLTQFIPQILGPAQNPNNYFVFFYSDAARTVVVPDSTNTLLTDIYVRVVDKNNPTSTADSTIKLTVIAQPIPNMQIPAICIDSKTGTVTNSYIISGYSTVLYDFQWKNSAGTVVSTDENFSADTAGDYTVEITSKSITGCASGVVPFTVVESAQPLDVTYTVSGWFTDDQTVTINAVPYKPELNNFLYSLDGKTPVMGSIYNGHVFHNVKTGPHEVMVWDANGCGGMPLPINVQLVYNPKFFTPNGDGINDKWMILGLENEKNPVYVFDRNGKLVVQLFTNGDGWDGTLNGQPLPSSDYWFRIPYVEDGVTKEYKSHFSLIR